MYIQYLEFYQYCCTQGLENETPKKWNWYRVALLFGSHLGWSRDCVAGLALDACGTALEVRGPLRFGLLVESWMFLHIFPFSIFFCWLKKGTPWKIFHAWIHQKMNLDGSDEFPFQTKDFLNSMLVLRGVYVEGNWMKMNTHPPRIMVQCNMSPSNSSHIFELQPFSTSMIVGERVDGLKFRHLEANGQFFFWISVCFVFTTSRMDARRKSVGHALKDISTHRSAMLHLDS